MNELVLRPLVRKTFVKGTIAIAIFSAVLDVNVSNFAHYLEFLAVSVSLVLAYVVVKRADTYIVQPESLVIKSFLAPRETIRYENIADLYISQGFLARRFRCGTVYILIKRTDSSNTFSKRIKVYTLKDVRDPQGVYELISSRLGFVK